MPYRIYYDQEPEPEHPLKRERPNAVASLFVHTAEWPDLDRIREAHGPTEIVDVTRVPIIPAIVVEVLCENADAAMALRIAWAEFCETSPYRPHIEAEREAWGRKLAEPEIADISPEWTV
jgi:hypothetical protein